MTTTEAELQKLKIILSFSKDGIVWNETYLPVVNFLQ